MAEYFTHCQVWPFETKGKKIIQFFHDCFAVMMLEATPKQGWPATYLELQHGYKDMVMQRVQNTVDA